LPRLYSVSPKDPERFALRLLLLHVRGAKSYDDLQTINGISYNTFKDAAKALNLIEDDAEWDKALADATVFKMPRELRNLFAMVLIHGPPSDALLLYNKYKADFMEDFHHSCGDAYLAEQLSLQDIQSYLLQFGMNLEHFKLPEARAVYGKVLPKEKKNDLPHEKFRNLYDYHLKLKI